MALLIKNGILGRSDKCFRGDLLIEGEKITAVGESICAHGAEVLDAEGKFVLPGGVDPHTHVMLHSGENTVSDGFEAASRAALLGGTTCFVDHPAFSPAGAPLSEAVELEAAEGAKGSWCDYGLHLVFQGFDETTEEQLASLAEEGFPTGKVYTTYAGRMRDEEILPLMRAAKKAGVLLFFHCENNAVTTDLSAWYQQELPAGPQLWPKSRPDYAEAEAVKRMLSLARAAAVPIYIVHLSTAAAYAEVLAARRAGQKVYVESCPQYLLLEDSCYKKENGLDYVMAPPLRKYRDREKLWKALAQGGIDTIGTDHCSFSRSDKLRAGGENVFKAPCGVPGLETRLELLFSEGVMKNRISPEQFVSVTAEAPARLTGLAEKGRLAPGCDADIIIIDPELRHTISAEKLHQKVDYTPYEGTEVTGRVTDVWLRGTHAAANSELLLTAPTGRLIKRKLR